MKRAMMETQIEEVHEVDQTVQRAQKVTRKRQIILPLQEICLGVDVGVMGVYEAFNLIF